MQVNRRLHVSQLTSDTMAETLRSTRLWRFCAMARSRREKAVSFLVTLPLCVLTYLVVSDLLLESYPVPPWFTPLAVPLVLGSLVAHTAWFWRRTPAATDAGRPDGT